MKPMRLLFFPALIALFFWTTPIILAAPHPQLKIGTLKMPSTWDTFDDTIAYDDGIMMWWYGGLHGYQLATRFTPLQDFELQQVMFALYDYNNITPVTIWLRADSAGYPGSVIWAGSQYYDSSFTWVSVMVDTTGIYTFPADADFWLELAAIGPPYEIYDQDQGTPERSLTWFAPPDSVWVFSPGDNFIRAVGEYAISPAVWITMTNTGPDTFYSSSGGILTYNISVGNNGPALSADVWVDVTPPSGAVYGPVLGPATATLPDSGWTSNRDRELPVPAGLSQGGTYTLNGYIGLYDPPANIIYAEDHFGVLYVLGANSCGRAEPDSNPFAASGARFNWSDAKGSTPEPFRLEQNSPNPFNLATEITFTLFAAARVRLAVYDLGGRRVAVLWDDYCAAGPHSLTFEAAALSSGIYLYRLQVNGFAIAKKMLLIK